MQSFLYLQIIHPTMYTLLAKINKVILPSFSKQQLDPAKAKKWQLAILAYRYYVTTRALSNK
jgi:hypothetical protein